jgi:hypothetical protein
LMRARRSTLFPQHEQRRKSQIKRSRNTSVGVDGWRPRLGRTFCSPASELWPDLINKTPPPSTTPMRDFLSLLICNGKASVLSAFRSKGRAPQVHSGSKMKIHPEHIMRGHLEPCFK